MYPVNCDQAQKIGFLKVESSPCSDPAHEAVNGTTKSKNSVCGPLVGGEAMPGGPPEGAMPEMPMGGMQMPPGGMPMPPGGV